MILMSFSLFSCVEMVNVRCKNGNVNNNGINETREYFLFLVNNQNKTKKILIHTKNGKIKPKNANGQ